MTLGQTSAAAREISWPFNEIITAKTPEGFAVEAIQSEPPGHPLFLGRPAPQAGVKANQPALRDGALVCGPNTTAFAADFWKNFKDFGFEVDLVFDTVDVDQTVLKVSGCWELRLATESGPPALHFIGYREPLRAVSVYLDGIEAGKSYTIKAGMTADGTVTMVTPEGDVLSQSLGQPPSDWVDFQGLFVGSANPRAMMRPFQGTISRLQFHAQELP
jgi:hypothetical protein